MPTTDEMQRLNLTPDPAMRWLLWCCCDLGLRFGTATRLTIAECASGKAVRLTKGGARTEVPLSGRMLALLRVAAQPGQDTGTAVCDALNGVPLTNAGWNQRWRKARKAAEVRREVRPHDMRRALARRMFAATRDLRQVQKLLAHKNVRSTLHYLEGEVTQIDNAALDAARKAVSGEQ